MSRDVFRILMLVFALASPPIRAEQAAVLKPATKAALARFKAWLKGNPETEDAEYLQRADTYITDLNNDGRPEYIAATIQGSGGFFYIYIWTLQSDGDFQPWRERGVGSDEIEYMYEDPNTHEEAPFTRLGGKTYMSTGGIGRGSRFSYTWEGDDKDRHPACGAAWTRYIRADFKRSYDHKDYELANTILDSFLGQCSSLLDEETRAWINNDLALTQYHLGETDGCLKYATRAKTTPQVASAAVHNEQLCPEAAKNLSTDFAWLRNAPRADVDRAIRSNLSKYEALLRAIIPNVDLGAYGDLRRVVRGGLRNQEGESQVLENRYVTYSAQDGHHYVMAMLWVDVKEHLGLVAFNQSASLSDKDPCQLTITSRTVPPDAIPAVFWSAFEQWRVQALSPEQAHGCVEFIGPDGKTSSVSPPSAPPDGEGAPSQSSPPP